MTHFADQVTIKLISQLIKGISRFLQKLVKYFNGTAIFAFMIPALLVLSNNLDLNLNDSEFLQDFLAHLRKNGTNFLFLNNYCYTSIDLYISITFALTSCVLYISLMQSINGAQLLVYFCYLWLLMLQLLLLQQHLWFP